jgi:dethiobiotin synthetase
LADAVTPSVAARRQRIEIDVERITRLARQTAATVDHAFVEGAGGWRAPLSDTLDMAALAVRLGFPVVLVAKATLGTLNHTLLTAEAIERDGAQLAAIVLSKRPHDDEALSASNAEELRVRRPEPLIVLESDGSVLDRLLRST